MLYDMMLCTNLIALISIITFTCSVCASNHGISYTTLDRFAFIPRGGSSDDTNIKSDVSEKQLIGIIDLRQSPDPDSIILLQKNNSNQDTIAVNTSNIVQFPTSELDDKHSNIDEELDQQAACSHSIGSLCSTVYLIIAYDYENGKTVLHRTFGGAKLMAFVNGVRSRWYNMNEAKQSCINTKLVLILVPSSEEQTMPFTTTGNIIDLTNCKNDWDASGADFLVERLSEAFQLGGEEYKQVNPFIVQMIASVQRECGEDSDNYISEVVLRNMSETEHGDNCIQTSFIDTPYEEIQTMIKNAYKDAGGDGNIYFGKIQYQRKD